MASGSLSDESRHVVGSPPIEVGHARKGLETSLYSNHQRFPQKGIARVIPEAASTPPPPLL